jgi:hypothetical protein
MAVIKKGSSRMPLWAVQVENYLLLLRKSELLELLANAGQTVCDIRHESPEKIRQTLLSLPREMLGMALRERIHRSNEHSN